MAAGQTLLIIPSLLLVKYAFDQVIPARQIPLLVLIGVAIFGLRVINSFMALWVRKVQIRVINQAVYAIRNALIRTVYRLPYLDYTNADLRTLHTRIVQDTERVSNMTTALLSRLLPSLIIGTGLLVICFVLNWYLVLIIIALIPCLFLAGRFTGKRIKVRVTVFQKAFEEFSKGIYFVLRYLPLTTLQSAREVETRRQQKILEDLREKTGRMADIFSVNLQLQETLTGLTAIIIIIVGGISVAVNRMTLGDFLSFYLAAMYLNKYVNTFTGAVPDIIAGNVSLNTLYDIAGEEEAEVAVQSTIDFTGETELRGIHFAYDRNPVLVDVNLHLKPGLKVAVIGDNGAGKTTLLNLIAGLLVPGQGTIYASGVSMETLDKEMLRRQMGIVSQHPPLFPGTIVENIVYGATSVDETQLERVCALALADEFVRKLPDGYQTFLGDEGILLSGGEGQRVAIARALYRNPRLLILDEPTNHLDPGAISRILHNLSQLDPVPAILLISHDREVVKFADEIYHLKEGSLHMEMINVE